ncbi:MAG: RNA polymerase sigma factor [Polyangiales bacterium]
MLARRATAVGRDDGELFAEVARGNLGALGALFDRHHEAVRSVAIHAGVPWHEADDAVQDTFLKLAAMAPRYDGRPDARPWILATAWRVAADRRRSLGRWLRALARLAHQAPAARLLTPEDERAAAERWEAFAARVAALPEKMGAAFVLVEVQGLSGEEAARALGIPVATVWTRLHHARKRMQESAGGGEP